MVKPIKIILASGSPRRQQFFKELDLTFEIRLKEIDEVYPVTLREEEITNYIALEKARAFEGSLADDELLITSDTLVWLNDCALGKPKDYDDAVAMLQQLSGVTHEVITSVCFKTTRSEELLFDKTKVTFAPIDLEAIHYYLKRYQPFDKAGAYGIQDWIGLTGIAKIEGSYTNVVGLPTEKVYRFLTTHYLK
ncbi:Maf family nucleotide pyrophosphatase [Flavobacterium sp.]|uniref:Maf family nucleotide pyrophosphatase n=1 Tax=Flavobacterium sp. TaxID=239 RepID=UPI002636CD96|nr:Maf family nucleotide pyrophosphatase [Flavobacterium sp.]